MDSKALDRKRANGVLLWGVAAVLAVNLAWFVYKAAVPLKVRADSPVYTVIRTEKGFDKAGTLRYSNEYVDAIRSDGSTMWRFSSLIARQRRIAFANGDGVMINELIGKKSTYPKYSPGLRVKRDPANSCSSESDAKAGMAIDGTDYVGNYRTIRYRQVSKNGVWKTWYAPDVGCALIQSRLEHEEGVTVQQLASLTLGEPDPSLFQISDSLQETPPSGLYVPNCFNGKCTTVPDSVKANLDQKYYAMRNQVP